MPEGRASVKRKILALVARYDGQFYWYQVEHGVRADGPEESGPFFAEIDALVTEGLIELKPNPAIDERDRYWLTKKAQAVLSEVLPPNTSLERTREG
jgi:hypothetical protein